MDKKLLNQLKEKLEQEKKNIESQLEKFAKKDDKVKGDWDTRFPSFDGGESGSAALEKAADEVEEYSTLLPLEYNLENQLKDINLALDKITKGTYGKCENCKGEIDKERLKVYPAARLCMKCEGK
ncbi:MAG: TraR/DksA C4-type zinc finger protein [Candidatus Pacebacteria bacterium]|nr:TraR/DksA C4-type zinc finger protein [Candidatus Paceibacterota bacterium]